jgi:hypothetical protein
VRAPLVALGPVQSHRAAEARKLNFRIGDDPGAIGRIPYNAALLQSPPIYPKAGV